MLPLAMEFEDEEALAEARKAMDGDEGQGSQPREFQFACELSLVPADGSRGKAIARENDEIALFRLGGHVHAISNLCPHELSPLLAFGDVDLDACTVACPLHGWTFDIRTGQRIGGGGDVPVYDVCVEAEAVWVSTESRA